MPQVQVRPFPPEFIMHSIECSLPAGKAGAAKMKEICKASLQFQKICAAEEVKMYDKILKTLG